ncbi:MAG: hypothetical protein HUU20_14385 [Pirellulales bacterium]|nr:hypothetical protein [Pirellulales bacterium]
MILPKPFCRVGCALAIAVGILVQVSSAAEPLETPKLSEAARSGWLNFGLLSGKVTLTGSRFGSINSTSSSNGRTERLTIRATGSGPAVKYEMTGSRGGFTLEVSAQDQLSIQWKPEGESSVPVKFWQEPGEKVNLEIGAAGTEKVCRAPSIWHLLIAEPAAARQHLVPILKLFQFDMDTAAAADQVESILLTAGAPVVVPDRQRWAALIERLGAESFAQREEADRELREAGRMVVTYLERLDPRQLDAEQQYRIRRIIQSVSAGTGNDTPERVAAWLAGDPSVWLSLLARDDESARRMASVRLQKLLGHPITFDPTAAADARAAQIEQLRLQLAPK